MSFLGDVVQEHLGTQGWEHRLRGEEEKDSVGCAIQQEERIRQLDIIFMPSIRGKALLQEALRAADV